MIVLFTWCNRQDGHERMYCKLDRVLANLAWLELFNKAVTVFKKSIHSDHAMAITQIRKGGVKKRPTFKYLSMWQRQESYTFIVEEAWKTNVHGNYDFLLSTKLKAVKRALQQLNVEYFRGICNQVSQLEKSVEEVAKALQADPFNTQIQQHYQS